MNPAEELRLAAARLRDDHNCNGFNLDCRSRELLALIAALLRTREPIALLLENAATEVEQDADKAGRASVEAALAIARAVLAPPRAGHVQAGEVIDRLALPAILRPRV
jgi:hypothetical protein